ncbi:MAG: DVU_1556 family methyltransferase [Anaerolineaceae bacterium]
MPDCSRCSLFQLESENEGCLHLNRPGGLEMTNTALASCSLPNGSSVLDAACGTGATLQSLMDQGYKPVGVDLSMEMLRKGAFLTTIQANCNQVPLLSASQDALLMECALSLSNEADGALSEFYRLLKPGGWLVVTDIYIREQHNPSALGCLSGSSCLAGAKTEAEIRSKIEGAGFFIRTWQDQTLVFKQWLARMVFKLGSLDAFYRQLSSCDAGSQALASTLGNKIKLGYYWMSAQKAG